MGVVLGAATVFSWVLVSVAVGVGGIVMGVGGIVMSVGVSGCWWYCNGCWCKWVLVVL